jgi:type I restriction enzyme R subunit
VPTPSEHKTVQARILQYAHEIGWTYVPRAEADTRRGFDPNGVTAEDRARSASLYFGDLLHAQVLTFNPKYKEAQGALLGEFRRLNADITGNRDFLAYLRNQAKFFCADENRELDLTLIDYGDLTRPPDQRRNVYEVTEEFYVHNGHYGTREDVVFLINGIPVFVIECKNATKDEAIALGVDQIRRYHAETPEVMVPEMLFTATEAIGFAYGVTWSTKRRNLFNWKHEELGNLEAKVKSFCAVPQLLRFLKDFILFAEKEEELQKVILRQHPDRCGGQSCSPSSRRGTFTRARVAHAGQRQDLYDDQGCRTALQGKRGSEADHPTHDRPQRAGRPDPQEPRGSRNGQRGACRPHCHA